MGISSLLDQEPRILPPLDRGFRPPVLARAAFGSAVQASQNPQTVHLGLERNNGYTATLSVDVLTSGEGAEAASYRCVERALKFLLWSRGGWKVSIAGPRALAERIRDAYRIGGERGFDAELMGRVYRRPFEVEIVAPDQIPVSKEEASSVGGHLRGCRIGFDLGASDYKLAAVIDGEPVFSTEIPWDPVPQSDPNYHIERIREGLKLAASKLPRVDAIGGSSAGIYVDNQPRVASLFRSVPPQAFESHIESMFNRIQEEWKVPLVLINDGDVTALAGGMSIAEHGVLGLAMGSSEAVGFLDPEGRITGWLNELAFAPVDMSTQAAVDEWSKDRGVGAMYFSQQAVNRLLAPAGIRLPEELGLPERLREVQKKVEEGHPGAESIFETIGVYLGYTIPYYREFYPYTSLLTLGRVTSGRGGEIILDKASEVLREEFPEMASINLVVPDEKSRRVGQAVAAASLPPLAAPDGR